MKAKKRAVRLVAIAAAFSAAVFVLCLFCSACSPSRVSEWNPVLAEKSDASKKKKFTVTALPQEASQENKTEKSSPPRLILETGNYITSGIPGFGENALSALTGEYRIPGKTELVKVWLTAEFVFLDRWAWRTSITGYTVMQKVEDIGRVVSSALTDSTLVILLPKGQELSLEEEDRLITTLIKGLSATRLGNLQNVSLPAMINW
jgi:hypothetical protein